MIMAEMSTHEIKSLTLHETAVSNTSLERIN